jgi:antirestriction protein ArdC
VVIQWGLGIEARFSGQIRPTFRQALSVGGNFGKDKLGTMAIWAPRPHVA